MWRFWRRRRPAWRVPVTVDRVVLDDRGLVVEGRLPEGVAFDDGGPVSAVGSMFASTLRPDERPRDCSCPEDEVGAHVNPLTLDAFCNRCGGYVAGVR